MPRKVEEEDIEEVEETAEIGEELTKESVEEVKEELVCPRCGAPVRRVKTPTATVYQCVSCGKYVSPIKPGEVPPERVLKPADIEMTEKVVEELSGKLRTVYGISKEKAIAIVDTIRGNPNIALNPMNLFMHIKQLEPRAHDYHLWIVINSLFQGLRSAGWTGAIPPFQAFQQQLAQQLPWVYGWQWQPYQQPTFGYGFQGYGAQGYWERQPLRHMPPTPMKVVVEGQEIETDMAGYMAWRRYLMEQEEQERRRRSWELEMKKLEAEIRDIEGRAAGKKGEEKVEVEVKGQKFRVSDSVAPLILALSSPKESDELKEMRERVEKLSDELRRREIESLETQLREVSKKLEEQPSFWEQLEGLERVADRLGYKRSGRTTIDVLDSLGERIDQRAQQLIDKLGPGVGEEFKPEVKRTVEERAKEVERLEKRFERSKEILEAENELLKAAGRLK